MNVANLKKRYAAVFNEDFDTLFLDEATLQMQREKAAQEAMLAAGGDGVGSDIQMPNKGGGSAQLETMFQ
jgi:hypothetical protein